LLGVKADGFGKKRQSVCSAEEILEG